MKSRPAKAYVMFSSAVNMTLVLWLQNFIIFLHLRDFDRCINRNGITQNTQKQVLRDVNVYIRI